MRVHFHETYAPLRIKNCKYKRAIPLIYAARSKVNNIFARGLCIFKLAIFYSRAVLKNVFIYTLLINGNRFDEKHKNKIPSYKYFKETKLLQSGTVFSLGAIVQMHDWK